MTLVINTCYLNNSNNNIENTTTSKTTESTINNEFNTQPQPVVTIQQPQPLVNITPNFKIIENELEIASTQQIPLLSTLNNNSNNKHNNYDTLSSSCNSTYYTPTQTPSTTPIPTSVVYNPMYYPSPCATPTVIPTTTFNYNSNNNINQQPQPTPNYDFNFNQIHPQQLEYHLHQLQQLNNNNSSSNYNNRNTQYIQYQPPQQQLQTQPKRKMSAINDIQPPTYYYNGNRPTNSNYSSGSSPSTLSLEEEVIHEDLEGDEYEDGGNVDDSDEGYDEQVDEEEQEDEELPYIDPKYLQNFKEKEKSIKSKLAILEKSSKFSNIREKSYNFLHEFTGESIVNAQLNIRGSKDFTYLKYKTLDSSLDNYISQERIDLRQPLIKSNIDKLKFDFYKEINKIISIRNESLQIMKLIHNLSVQLRPPLLNEQDLKAQRNHIHGFFSLLISHQKCLSFDFIYQMRPQSMDHQHYDINNNQIQNTVGNNNNNNNISNYDTLKKNRRTLNDQYKTFISDYFKNHSAHPYPNEEEKIIISALIDLSKYQRNNLFSNKRSREKNQRIVNLKKQKEI